MRLPETHTPTIDYPESDGQPMGETELHIRWMIRLRELLLQRFCDGSALVGSDLMFYYQEGNPTKVLVPDVFVVLGSSQDPPRRTFKTWEEERLPDVVFEIVSRSTVDRDLGEKSDVYAQLGVREYFLFDPESAYLQPPLRGFELRAGEFHEKLSNASCIASEVLNCNLRVREGNLELIDRLTNEPWLTATEVAWMVAERERAAAQRERAAKERERETAVRERETALREREIADRERAVAEHERTQRLAAEAEIERLKSEIARLKEGD